MQTSHDPKDWHENEGTRNAREALLKRGSSITGSQLRQFYPYMARLTRRDLTSGMPVGYVFKFARTKDEPSNFPIEVYCTPGEAGRVFASTSIYAGNEVELIVPED